MAKRYQQEIEEILRKAGEAAPPKKVSPPRIGFRRLAWLQMKQSLGGKAWSISPGRVMLAALLILLAAAVMSAAMPGLATPIMLAGLILFIVAYGMFFVRPRKVEKRWRGQTIEEDDS